MSCLKADICKEYQKNVGNPYTHQNPCNECKYNMSDYEIGYQKGKADGIDELVNRLRIEPISAYIMDIIYHDAEQLKGK